MGRYFGKYSFHRGRSLKEAVGFESGEVLWKILFPQRQKWGNSTENQFLHCSAPEFAWKTEIYVDSQSFQKGV